jgi:hypothetical protein
MEKLAALPAVHNLDPSAIREAIRVLDKRQLLSFFEGLASRAVPRSGDLPGIVHSSGLLSEGGFPRFRINLLGELPFITDLPRHGRLGGVFPYEDESAALLQRVKERGLSADVVVDLASGCGHSVVAAPYAETRIGVDVSQRAGSLTVLNAALNERLVEFHNFDFTAAELLETVVRPTSRHLFILNAPHAPVPVSEELPAHSAGGPTGSDLVCGALENLARHRGSGAKVLVYTYSIGALESNRWHILERSTELFGDGVSWSSGSQKVWRVNGVKQERPPMPLDGLRQKAFCRLSISDVDRPVVEAEYSKLADSLAQDGWDVLGVGFLEISL